MTNTERRVKELEFYYTIQHIYSIKRDADFLVTMLEGLHFIVDFNVEKVVHYVNKFNLNPTWQPYKGEVIGVLYKYSKIPMNAVCAALDVSRTTGYKMANKYLSDEYIMQPKVPEEDLQHLINVIEAYQQLRSVLKANV